VLSGFAVVLLGVERREGAGKNAIVLVVNIQNEIRKGKEAAGVVGKERAALSSAAMRPDGEKSHFEVGNVKDVAELDGLVAEGQNHSSSSGAGDPLAVSDRNVAVLQRSVREEGLAHRDHIAGTSAVHAG
jgi:hypothetical protein